MTAQPGSSLSYDKLLLALLGGFALGAVVVALTPETASRELRASLRAMGNRLLGRNLKAGSDLDEAVEALFI